MNTTEFTSLDVKFPTDFSPPKGVEIHPQRTVMNWYFNGIYHIYVIPSMEHTIEDAKMQTDLMKELFGDEKVKVLLNLRDDPGLTYEARKHYGTEEGKWNNGYTAVIVSSAFNKVLANFLIGAFKSSLKTKLFLSVEDAVEWLKIER